MAAGTGAVGSGNGSVPRQASTGRFFSEIESMRGLASFLVLLLHMQGWLRWGLDVDGSSWPLSVLVLGGHSGVSLFFVISGFLLGGPFVAEIMGGRRVSRRGYAERRARRILPLYVLAVIVACAVTARQLADVRRGVPYLLFLQAVPGFTQRLGPFSDVWWSLATEVQCYLLLPLLPILWRRCGGRVAAMLLSVAMVGYIVLAQRWWMPDGVFTYAALMHTALGRGPVFACGVLAAAVSMRWGERIRATLGRSPWWRRGGGDLILAVNGVALLLLLRWVVRKGYWVAEVEWQWWHGLEGVLWSAWLLGLLWLPARMKVLFCNPVWAGLGLISYSIYIWHNPIIVYWTRWVPGAVGTEPAALVFGAGGAIAAIIGVSALSYRLIERPFLRRG